MPKYLTMLIAIIAMLMTVLILLSLFGGFDIGLTKGVQRALALFGW